MVASLPHITGTASRQPGSNSSDKNTHIPPSAPPPDRLIRLCVPPTGKEGWRPGAGGLYPRPRGASPFGTTPYCLPIWNPKTEGVGRQQAMFDIADGLSPSGAFYVAADVWTKRDGKDWSLGKVFGAFQSANAFLSQLLEIAPHRCFYEIIRENRPCKAYFDLEAAPGAMSAADGAHMREQVILAWAVQVRTRWPQAEKDCPRCLEPMVLDGSRHTEKGWKVSYHVIYPWLTFPCNTTSLKEEATKLGLDPRFQYPGPDGLHRFLDIAVYTRNRQFRTPLSWKLTDSSRTALRWPGDPRASKFGLACITRIEPDTWTVPVEPFFMAQVPPPPVRHIPTTAATTRLMQDDPIVRHLYRILKQQGHPEGRLTSQGQKFGMETFRWEVSPNRRPCTVAQQWRPDDPTHDSNAALVQVDSIGAVYLLSACTRNASSGNTWTSSLLCLHS